MAKVEAISVTRVTSVTMNIELTDNEIGIVRDLVKSGYQYFNKIDPTGEAATLGREILFDICQQYRG